MAFPDDSERKCKVTIDAANIDASLSGFPIQILLADVPTDMMDGGIFSCLNGGGDIRAGNADGTTRYPLEVVRCVTSATPASRELELHVNVTDTISSSSDTDVWLYYKEAGATQPAANSTYGSESVWDSNFILVSHDGGATNSTSNADPTAYGTEPSSTSGKEPGTLARDYNNHEDDDGYTLTISHSAVKTFEVLHYSEGSVTDFNSMLMATHNAGITEYHAMAQGSSGDFFTFEETFTDFTTGGTATVNTWQMISARFDGTTAVELYVDGASVDTNTSPTSNASQTVLDLGVGYDAENACEGLMAEMRYSDIDRGDAWILATQEMIWDHANFYNHTPVSEATEITRDQKAFRFYDDGTEAGAVALAAQNVDINIGKQTTFQITIGMQTTGDTPSEDVTLQYRLAGSSQAWKDVD